MFNACITIISVSAAPINRCHVTLKSPFPRINNLKQRAMGNKWKTWPG
jgi:hypothetical protein